MRLLSVELGGFRGFAQKREIDLDADAVVVIGANGHGKTSLFDGILWALSGRIPRLQVDDSTVVSMYSETGQARVLLRFKDQAIGNKYAVTRSFDGKEKRLTLETPSGSLQGPSAEGMLIDLAWPDAAGASDSNEALAAVLTRSVYLQQDLVRQFIDAASPQERFSAVSELVGAGRVTELQDSLERSKKAWTTATNQRQDALRPSRERLAIVDARLSELTARSSQATRPISSQDWDQWWESLTQLGLKSGQVESASREAPSAISSAIKELDARRRLTERTLQALGIVLADIRGLAGQGPPDVQALRENAAKLSKEVEDLKRVTTKEQARLADQRRHQAELNEKDEQLRALAALALKHLGDHCPVCAQTYDQDTTRKRLENLTRSGTGRAPDVSLSNKFNQILDALSAKEKEASAAELALRTGEQLLNGWQVAERALIKRLSELDISERDNRKVTVARSVAYTETLIKRLTELQQIGESLALRLAQSSASATVDELRREANTLRHDITEQDRSIAARTRTGDSAQRVIEALREAASAVVEERLREINPLLQNIWARIDPHPAFRLVSFFSQVFRGKGQLSTIVSDPIEGKMCETPQLSSPVPR